MRLCAVCCAPTIHYRCPICRDPERDHATICVVEDLTDLLAVEATGTYRGLYHVLHGTINPVDGIGPDQLHVRELDDRVRAEGIAEVILATKPDTHGEVTAEYLQHVITALGIPTTRRR
jgi:recombination protein RecR